MDKMTRGFCFLLEAASVQRFVYVFAALLVLSFSAAVPSGTTHAQSPILIGLDADMSAASAEAGEAIRRGAILAIGEINEQGGLLGRSLELVVRDHRGNPARGVDNIQELSDMPDLLAVVGGLHTPVALQQLKSLHEKKIIYLGAWAAGTPIVANGYEPNYVFRVSVRDEYAGGFMVKHALDHDVKKLGLLLERTGWGRSNEKAVTTALAERGLVAAGVEWFNWGIKDMGEQIERLHAAGADGVILVANPPEGLAALKSMAARPESARLPIISHWGITGGKFPQLAGDLLDEVDLVFLQTFSFLAPPFPERADKIFERYRLSFTETKTVEDVMSPPGTAHAYDLIKLLGKAVEKAGSLDRAAVRDALERIESHEGLMRNYAPPFSPTKHDALDASDFIMARYGDNGVIVPDKAYSQ